MCVSQLNNSLDGFSFGYTDDGKPGYREVGADTVVPFRSKKKLIFIQSIKFTLQRVATQSATINCTAVENYNELTADDFFINVTSLSSSGDYNKQGSNGSVTKVPSKSYDSATGILTVSGYAGYHSNGTNSAQVASTIDIYILI